MGLSCIIEQPGGSAVVLRHGLRPYANIEFKKKRGGNLVCLEEKCANIFTRLCCSDRALGDILSIFSTGDKYNTILSIYVIMPC